MPNNRKWIDFVSIDLPLPPTKVRDLLISELKIQVTNELMDPITDELYLDFTYRDLPFSMHNPYSSAYGYWFFFSIRHNEPEITEYLKSRLISLESQYM